MTRRVSKKPANAKKQKVEKLEFVQDFLPIKNLSNGIIETVDGRYIKILEIEPINFLLRSDEEQMNIISSFASWLKISPMRLQFKSITRKADSDKHIAMVREELAEEDNEKCIELSEDYIRLIKDIGNREALTRRFFLIFQYEAVGRNESDDYGKIYAMLQTAEQNARAYFMQCGNTVLQPRDPDEATAEILYMYFNRRSCIDEPFNSRVNRVVVDTMAAKNKIIGIDPVPNIKFSHFIVPRGIDLSHYNYIVMDGLYYSFLYIKKDGFPNAVRGGWMSSIINAGEGIDVDIHLHRENRSRTIDKVAQRIRLNRTKLKSLQDTSTDYEELTNSISAGYYIKNGIANNNEDLFYLSVFITVSAKSYEELIWRKRQMVDMLKSMDIYILSDQDATMAFLSSLFFSCMFIKLTRYADSTKSGSCDVPVNLILDEFNNIGRIGGAADGSDFCRALSTIRGRNIRVMLAVQSLGQLQNRYPQNLWSEIVGNCDIQLMLGCTDDVSAEYFSARSGDMSIEVNSTMTVRRTIAVAQVIPQYRHTEGQGRRRLLTPDEVLRLPNEELLCIIRGHNVLKLKKLDYTKHPMSSQIIRSSIMDYCPADAFHQPVQTEPLPSASEPVKKPARRKSLYSSAKPPSEF